MCQNLFVRVLGMLSFISLVLGDVSIVTRSQWNAKEPANPLTALQLPAGRVIIAHTAEKGCDTQESCSKTVRDIQTSHMARSFDDIAYNYLVGGDGNVYEGRGSDNRGAVAKKYNDGSIGVSFIGDFSEQPPSAAALKAGKELLEQLVRLQKLKPNYKLNAHNQFSNTLSPGEALVRELQKWKNWSADI